MNVTFLPVAWDHWLYWQENDKAIYRKLNGLIKECLRHAYEGTGKPEPLKGDLASYWSRRIDREHRLVYRVEGDILIIVQCRYHY